MPNKNPIKTKLNLDTITPYALLEVLGGGNPEFVENSRLKSG